MPEKDENTEALLQQLATIREGNTLTENIRKTIATQVNELINHDFEKLVQLLYRLDIDEVRLKRTLQDYPGRDASEMITDLIIERQLQKMKARSQFKRDNNIDENEKW